MNPDRQQALEYLRVPAGGLWHWAENGAVLVWRDGGTIAFREEIIQVLESLAPNGLPSFGAIVFLLAACRGKLPTVADIVQEHATPLLSSPDKNAMLVTARSQLKVQLEAAIGQLARIPDFAASLNAGIQAKCVLAEAVFEAAKAERHVDARTVLRGMREPMSNADLSDPNRVGLSGSYVRQIHMVAEGLKWHTAESLDLRLRTGLDVLPKDVDANLPIAERAQKLIEELSRDREHGAVARAARDLMAAVRLPRRLGESDQLPIGGVSDITNRGSLDRLLLSELAHDDLTLSVRVALNEALYLRREPPMREPPGTLALLLDSGLRLWGVPRVLATAVALAMIARDKQHREVLAWRAHGEKLQTIDLLSRKGLIEHLGALETSAHPGESVRAFVEALGQSPQNQSVLITHRDALGDAEFRRALEKNPAAPGYVAAVDRLGRFELHAMPLSRRAPLCGADLDLESVFEGHKGVSPMNAEVDLNLPAILGVTPFPFLLPLAGKMDLWIKAGDGFIYAVMNDRRLVRYLNQSSGVRVLAHNLPSGRTVWLDCVDGTVHAVKAGSGSQPARLLSFSPHEGELRVTELTSGPGLLAVHRYGDTIILIRHHDVRAHALSDGRLLGQALNPHQWMGGRFFRGTNDFYFVAWDGERVKFEPVTIPKGHVLGRVEAIFDRDGFQSLDGPWLLTATGEVVATATDERFRLEISNELPSAKRTITPSRDGHRIHVAAHGHKSAFVYHLDTGKSQQTPVVHSPAAILDPPPGMPCWNMYRVIESAARLGSALVLGGRNNRFRRLILNARKTLQIFEIPAGEKMELQGKAAFSTPASKTRHGCSLQTIQYPCGSKLFLDSRGLLHLKSSDPGVPEVSLVLSEGEVAGWTSDGHVCGPAFFFDGPRISEPEVVFERLMRILNRL